MYLSAVSFSTKHNLFLGKSKVDRTDHASQANGNESELLFKCTTLLLVTNRAKLIDPRTVNQIKMEMVKLTDFRPSN